MKAIDDLKARLAAVGATLDESCMDVALHCDAPSGYVWRANGLPCISTQYRTNRQSWLIEALRTDCYPRLKMGLEKVTDAAELAAIRYDLDDDNWGAPEDAPATLEFK